MSKLLIPLSIRPVASRPKPSNRPGQPPKRKGPRPPPKRAGQPPKSKPKRKGAKRRSGRSKRQG